MLVLKLQQLWCNIPAWTSVQSKSCHLDVSAQLTWLVLTPLAAVGIAIFPGSISRSFRILLMPLRISNTPIFCCLHM